MELFPLGSLFLVSLAMSLAVTSARPYPAWLEREYEKLQGQGDTATFGTDPTELMNSVQTLRKLIALQTLRHRLVRPSSPNFKLADQAATSRSKRLDFGFAGIDNIDHILSILAETGSRGSGPASGDSSFYKTMKSKGYRGSSNIEEMKKIMRTSG